MKESPLDLLRQKQSIRFNQRVIPDEVKGWIKRAVIEGFRKSTCYKEWNEKGYLKGISEKRFSKCYDEIQKDINNVKTN